MPPTAKRWRCDTRTGGYGRGRCFDDVATVTGTGWHVVRLRMRGTWPARAEHGGVSGRRAGWSTSCKDHTQTAAWRRTVYLVRRLASATTQRADTDSRQHQRSDKSNHVCMKRCLNSRRSSCRWVWLLWNGMERICRKMLHFLLCFPRKHAK